MRHLQRGITGALEDAKKFLYPVVAVVVQESETFISIKRY